MKYLSEVINLLCPVYFHSVTVSKVKSLDSDKSFANDLSFHTVNTASVNYISQCMSPWQICWQQAAQQIYNMNNALTNEREKSK